MIEKKAIEEIVEDFEDPKIVGFSSYVWNHNYNLAVAKAIKQKFPKCLIIFGGPSVPYKNKDFLLSNRYIDYVIYNEGELAFYDLLCNLQNRTAKQDIRGIGYLEGDVLFANDSTRIQNLDCIPSPYSEGLFDNLVKYYRDRDVTLNVILETNRGCPYRCTFCDWGNGILGKVKQWDISKVKKEIDWIGKNKIEFITVADANFGIYKEKDYAIAEYVVKTKAKYNFPKFFHYSMSKAFFPVHVEIAKLLLRDGLLRTFSVSLQDTNEDVLEAIKRKNISDEGFENLYQMCKKENVPIAAELMLGLPNQTYDAWMNAINYFHEKDIYTVWNPTSILPNTEMNRSEYRKKYKLATEINVMPTSEFVDEHEEVIVQTNSMTKKDLNDAIIHTYVIDVLHGHGFTDMIAKFYSKFTGGKLIDFYTLFYQYFIVNPNTIVYEWLDPLKNHVVDKKTYQLYGGATNYPVFQRLGWTERKRFFSEIEKFLHTIIDKKYAKDLIATQNFRQIHTYDLEETILELEWDVIEYVCNDKNKIQKGAVYKIHYTPIDKNFDTFANFIINGRFLKKWKASFHKQSQ